MSQVYLSPSMSNESLTAFITLLALHPSTFSMTVVLLSDSTQVLNE